MSILLFILKFKERLVTFSSQKSHYDILIKNNGFFFSLSKVTRATFLSHTFNSTMKLSPKCLHSLSKLINSSFFLFCILYFCIYLFLIISPGPTSISRALFKHKFQSSSGQHVYLFTSLLSFLNVGILQIFMPNT